MAKKKKVQTDEKDLLGVEKYYNKYAKWAVNLPPSKVVAGTIVGLIVSAGIILTTMVVSSLPSWSIPLITWPIGLFLFLAGLGIAIRRANADEDIITIKERFSFRQRLKLATIVSIVFVAALLSVSQYIPNSIGGVTAIVYVLSAVNTIRRTPAEVEINQLGLIDERDMTDEEYDAERAQYFSEDDEEYPDEAADDFEYLDDDEFDETEGDVAR